MTPNKLELKLKLLDNQNNIFINHSNKLKLVKASNEMLPWYGQQQDSYFSTFYS